MFKSSKKLDKQYLAEGRLADVIALIQVLALDPHTHRTEDGLLRDLSEGPKSAASWTDVGKSHPEFFRVRVKPGESTLVSLVSRHVIPEIGGVRVLPPDFAGQLIEAAINLHDRQVRRDERWTYLVPIWVSLLGGIFALIVVYTKILLRQN